MNDKWQVCLRWHDGKAYDVDMMKHPTGNMAASARVGLALALLAASLLSAGCGTIQNVRERRPEIYGGVKTDAKAIAMGCAFMTPGSLEPLSSGAAPFLGVLCILGGIVDMPLSFVGDTLTLPYVLLKPGIVARSPETRRMLRSNIIFMNHRATDGPYVNFEDVVAWPERYSNQVLRSAIRGNGDFIVQDRRIQLDRIWPESDSRGRVYHVRYWCPGERDADTNMFSCVVLQYHDSHPSAKFGEPTFEGKWDIYCTLRTETQTPMEYRRPEWCRWLTIVAEGSELVGDINRGQHLGTIRGQVQEDGTFKGTCQMFGDSNTWESLTLSLSPYGDVAGGTCIRTGAPDGTLTYTIDLVR